MARRDPNALSAIFSRSTQYAVPPATPASSSSSTTAPPDHAPEGIHVSRRVINKSVAPITICPRPAASPAEAPAIVRSASRDRLRAAPVAKPGFWPKETQEKLSCSNRSEAARRREESARIRKDLHREKAKELQEIIARASPRVHEPPKDCQNVRMRNSPRELQNTRILDSSSRSHELRSNARLSASRNCNDEALPFSSWRKARLQNERRSRSSSRGLTQSRKNTAMGATSPRNNQLRHDLEDVNARGHSARRNYLQHSASDRRLLVTKGEPSSEQPSQCNYRCDSAVMQHSASEPRMLLATSNLLPNSSRLIALDDDLLASPRSVDEAPVENNDDAESPCQMVWQALEEAMLSLSDERQKERVVSRVETLLELMAEQCERSLRSYSRAEELASRLKDFEQQIEDYGDSPHGDLNYLLAIRKNILKERNVALTEAAEAEKLARTYERESTSAVARVTQADRHSSRRYRPPQTQFSHHSCDDNKQSSAAHDALLLASGQKCAAELASMSLGLFQSACQKLQSDGCEWTSFLEQAPKGRGGDVGSFQCS